MARCDEGYRCEVCGGDVESIIESDLYLRYVLREVAVDELHRLPERHIRCNPVLAQFIVDHDFSPVECPGVFNKTLLMPSDQKSEEARVTKAWRRLRQVSILGIPIAEYPDHMNTIEDQQ